MAAATGEHRQLQTLVGCFAQLGPLKDASTDALDYGILVGRLPRMAQLNPHVLPESFRLDKSTPCIYFLAFTSG